MVEDKALPQEPRAYRFSVQEFLRMGELGLFESQHRLQPIKGEIVEVEVMGPDHFNAAISLARRLHNVQDEVLVAAQCPLVLSDSATLQPGTPAQALCLSRPIQWN